MKLIIILLCHLTCCLANVLESGITNEERDFILRKHNDLRSLIREGKVPGQPKGTNLKNLQWDSALATEAQKVSDICLYQHQPLNDKRWDFVGQSLASDISKSDKIKKNWDIIIQEWFDENKVYKYPDSPTSKTGHYTQLVSGNTERIGCGVSKCLLESKEYLMLYTCNYGPGGNGKRAPYRKPFSEKDSFNIGNYSSVMSYREYLHRKKLPISSFLRPSELDD